MHSHALRLSLSAAPAAARAPCMPCKLPAGSWWLLLLLVVGGGLQFHSNNGGGSRSRSGGVTVVDAAKDLPAEFAKCKRDENFDKCLVDAVNGAIVHLKAGNKEFGIPPLEPLAVKSLVIEAGSGAITLKQTLKNMLVHDMISTSKVLRYRTDLNNHLIVCDSKTDRIEMIGDYEMSGRILLLPITGKGRGNLTLINTRIEHRLIGEPFEKDGVKYMRLKEYRVDLNPKRVYMHFENLFNDALLSQTMNRFLNDNWETVFNELKSGYSESFGQIFRDISNRLFERIPFDSIFLSS